MTVLQFTFCLFVVQPVAEYWIHRAVHMFRLQEHMQHHACFSLGRYWDFYFEPIVWFTIILCILSKQHTIACMILKHSITHYLVHRKPSLRFLHRHHFMHHRDATCNFCFSALWPDYIFGTLAS